MERTCVIRQLCNTDFIEMNANVIQFEAGSFDFAVCNLAFPFFAEPLESMRGINTSLTPGAPIVISVPGRNTWREFFAVAEGVLGESIKFAKPFIAKFDQAEKLPAAMEEAGFTKIEVTTHPIAFTFMSGNDVLSFFQELFSLLSYVPDEIKSGVSEAIDTQFPNGFTMHYEAVIIQALSTR